MSNSRLPIALTGVVLVLVLVSCSKDPQAQYKFHMSRADKYVQQNKLPEALVEYASAIKADGKSSDAQFRLGMIALRLRQYQRAYQALSKAVELDPNNMEARARLAELFAEARSYDRAEKEVQVILDHDPSSAVGHRLMGMINLARNKPQEAVAEFIPN